MSFAQRIKKLFAPMDLTKGNITKCLLIFSLPIMLSFLFQQVYSLTDAAIAGQNLSATEIAGISDSGCLTYIVLDFGFGCTAGFSAITAKAVGSKNNDLIKKSFSIQIVLTFVIGLFLTILSIFCIDLLLKIINLVPGTETYEMARKYIFIFFLGTIAQLFYNLFNNILRALGDSLTPLLFLIFSCLLNIGLDLLFMITFKWGVAGAALATIISQTVSAVGCFIYSYKRYSVFHISLKDLSIDFKYALEHLKNGLPLGLQFSVLAFGIIIMQGAVVNFDNVSQDPLQPAQLGYGATNKLIGLFISVPNAIGNAVLAFTGQNYGAKQYQRIREGIKKANIITFVACLICTITSLLLCIKGAYLYLFLQKENITEATIKYGTYYYFANMPIFFFLGFLFVGRNSLQGIEKPLFPFLAGVVELASRIVISLYFPSLFNPSNPTSDLSYFMLMTGDGLAWMLAYLTLLIGLIINVYTKPNYKLERK
ncbi:MAG: MATE family efflux transporter [Bacilli bacterium]